MTDPRRPDLLVTDFVGTVLREDGVVVAAYHRTFAMHGIPCSDDELAARRGASKRAVFRELAGRVAGPEAGVLAEEALVTFEAALRDAYTRGPLIEVDGAAEAMRRLRDAGILLALTSGFDRGLMDLLIGRLGWQEMFDVTLASDVVPMGRPAPFLIYRAMQALDVHTVSRVAVVGDTPLDLESAQNARAGWVIGVLSGAHGLATLGTARHTHLIPSVAALPALFGVSDPPGR
jgi:phosphonatase-like hydrolase